VAGFYWKLTLTRQFDWIWGPDLAAQVLPWLQAAARQWHEKWFPLWDPYLWAGQPLLGQAQPGVAYPLNWLLFALPLRDGHLLWGALQWYFVVTRFLAAAFCYLLCRDLGRSRPASLAGGLAFALCGFVASTGWPQMVNGAVWLPLVFLFLLRATRGQKVVGNAALSGMFLGMAWLSGHHQVPMFATVAVAGAWLYLIFRERRPDWRFVRAAVVAMVITVLTGALQILPAYEYGHLAKRWVGEQAPLAWSETVPYSVHEAGDLQASSLLGLVYPNIKTSFDPFVGVVALSLALLGIAACWRDSRVRFLTVLAVGGLVYALGHNSVLQGFLYAVIPSLDKARSPAAAVVLYEFAVAVLAAFGLDRLGSAEASPWPRRMAWTVLAFGILTAALFQAVFFANKLNFPADSTVLLTGLIAILLGALVLAWNRGALGRSQASALVILLLLLELGMGQPYTITDRSDADRMKWNAQILGNQDIAAYLKLQPGYPRALVAEDAFHANWGAWHDVEMWGGLLAGVSSNMLSFDTSSLQAHILFGVRYIIAAKPPEHAGPEVFAGAGGLKVYEQQDAFPRAWAVHSLVQVHGMNQGNRLIVDHLWDLRNQAFLLQAPPAVDVCGGTETVTLEDDRGGRVKIASNLACRGMVIVSDTFYPGWRAWIDGRPAKIHEVNGAMRGVVTPAGQHVITMRYRPLSAMLGAGLSALGVALALVLARRVSA